MTQPSDKEKLFARRKAYNELRRKIQANPAYTLLTPEEMSPFAKYMHDNCISPPFKRDWGLTKIENASPEVLQLQAFYRQATSEAARNKIGAKIRGGPVVIPIPDDPEAALDALLQADRENGEW